MEKVREGFDATIFRELSTSTSGLINSQSSSEETKIIVNNFTEISWQLWK